MGGLTLKIAVPGSNRFAVLFALWLCVTALGFLSASAQTLPPTNNLVMWLKADSLALADGAAVNSWGDSSGSGHDAVKLTGWNAPTFATNGINGHPALLFSSNTQSLFVTNNVHPTSLTLRLPTGLTFAASFKTFDTSAPLQTPNWTANPILADNTGTYTAFAFGISGGTGRSEE